MTDKDPAAGMVTADIKSLDPILSRTVTTQTLADVREKAYRLAMEYHKNDFDKPEPGTILETAERIANFLIHGVPAKPLDKPANTDRFPKKDTGGINPNR